MKKNALLVSLAGLACTSAALASDSDILTGYGKQVVTPASGNGGTFGQRVNQVVYGAAVDLRGYSDGGFPKLSADDVDFAGGPGAGGTNGANGPLSITGAYYGVVCPAGSPATNGPTDVRISFYGTFSGWANNTFPGAALIAQRTGAQLAPTPGYIQFFDGSVGVPGIPQFVTPVNIPINPTGTDTLATLEALLPGTTTVHPTNWIVTGGPAFLVGTSDAQRWGDSNGNLLIDTAAPEVNPTTAPRRLYMGFSGDAPACPSPAGVVNIATPLADGVTTVTNTVPAGGVRWFSFTLPAAADDDVFRFLDIDTEGSGIDTNIAVYVPADGQIVGIPGTDRGSGTNAMVSFGVGRRAAIGDGDQFDGYTGDLLNDLGNTYIVGVSDGPASFGPCYSVNNVGGAGGAFTLNFRTNVNAGVNDPSVQPVINGVDFNIQSTSGTSIDPGTNPGLAQTHERDSVNTVIWSVFTTTAPVCEASGSLVFDFASLTSPVADSVAYIFDSTGQVVGFGDDGTGTPAAQPDISYGVGGNSGGGLVPGQTNTLPAGTYFIATLLFDADNSDIGLSSDDRWHVRGRSGSSLDVGVNIEYTPGDAALCDGGGTVCNDIDFNNDEGFFDPTDVDAFLSVFGEGPCIPATATCDDIDFNNDNGFFDPCDIDSFLLQFAEGPCTPCGI